MSSFLSLRVGITLWMLISAFTYGHVLKQLRIPDDSDHHSCVNPITIPD